MRLTPEQKERMRCSGCHAECYDDFGRHAYVEGCSTCRNRRQKRVRRAGGSTREVIVPHLEPRKFFERNHPMVVLMREHER